MRARDKAVVVVLLAVFAAVSVGAVYLDAAERGGIVPAYGGTYVEGVTGSPRYFDPVLASSDIDQDVVRLVFSGLTRFDHDGRVVGDLASYRVTDDGKVWTFTIRDDARWQDGTPVTAADVIYTTSLLQDPAYAGPYLGAFRGVRVESAGDRVVRFTLPDAYGAFGANTTVPLLPEHLLGRISYAELAAVAFNQRPVGSGPFRVVSSDARQVTLARNDDYYGVRPERARPYLDRIVLRSYPGPSEALTALARGEVDGVGGLSAGDAERARTLKGVSLYSFPTNDFVALFLNVRPEKQAFRETVVRQAIATAIDKGRVLDVALDGRGRVADQMVPPTSWAYVKDLPRFERSYDAARAMLDAAGWKDGDGDGIRDKGGVKLAFELATSDEPARAAAAAQIKSDLGQIGIDVRVRAVPFAELVQVIVPPRAFDALLIGVAGSGDPEPYALFHSSEIPSPGSNLSGYFTLPMDRALEAARRTSDEAKRLELLRPVFEAIATEQPVIFLYFADYLYAQSTKVQGLRVMPITAPSARLWNVADWYVKTAISR